MASRKVAQKQVVSQAEKERIEKNIADKKKAVEVIDYEKYFSKFETDDFKISDDELKEDIKKFAPKPNVRTYEELRKEAKKKLSDALSGIRFAAINEATSFVKSDESEIEPLKSYRIDHSELKKTLFEFAFIFGNYTRNRKWIRIEDGVYFALPDLLQNGNHTVLVTVFAEQIAQKLKTIPNALIIVLEKKNYEINEVTRPYCFSKGHLICPENVRVPILNDLKIIFSEMGKLAQNRDFSKITTLAKLKR